MILSWLANISCWCQTRAWLGAQMLHSIIARSDTASISKQYWNILHLKPAYGMAPLNVNCAFNHLNKCMPELFQVICKVVIWNKAGAWHLGIWMAYSAIPRSVCPFIPSHCAMYVILKQDYGMTPWNMNCIAKYSKKVCSALVCSSRTASLRYDEELGLCINNQAILGIILS